MGNTGKMAVDMSQLTFNTGQQVIITGSDFGVTTLNPGECVAVFAQGSKPRLPNSVHCNPVGNVLMFPKNQSWWTEPFDVYYQGIKLGTCKPNQNSC